MAKRFASHRPKTRGPARQAAEASPAEPAEPATVERAPAQRRREIGGPAGPEPTRYGDWERRGICVDF